MHCVRKLNIWKTFLHPGKIGQLGFQVEALPEMKQKSRFLERLHFPPMHSREDVIDDAETGTFSWLLGNADSIEDNDRGLKNQETPSSSLLRGEYKSIDDDGELYLREHSGSLPFDARARIHKRDTWR